MPAEFGRRWGRAVILAGLSVALSGCAAEPPPVVAAPPAVAGPPAKAHGPGRTTEARGLTPALAESLRAGLIRAQEALKAGAIDAAAYERILLNHQRTVATMAAIEALGWGSYPPPPAAGSTLSPRPPTRVEAIERLTEMLYRPESEAKPRTNPRR